MIPDRRGEAHFGPTSAWLKGPRRQDYRTPTARFSLQCGLSCPTIEEVEEQANRSRKLMIYRFRWQIDDKLAGMSRPFIQCGEDKTGDDTRQLRSHGITAIVSLVESPADASAVRAKGFDYYSFPIPDGSPPSLATSRAIVETISRLIDSGEKVAVHCTAGLGRTGTVLALYLVHRGMSARDAIAAVRSREPMAIENPRQERAVFEYEAFMQRTGRRAKT